MLVKIVKCKICAGSKLITKNSRGINRIRKRSHLAIRSTYIQNQHALVLYNTSLTQTSSCFPGPSASDQRVRKKVLRTFFHTLCLRPSVAAFFPAKKKRVLSASFIQFRRRSSLGVLQSARSAAAAVAAAVVSLLCSALAKRSGGGCVYVN